MERSKPKHHRVRIRRLTQQQQRAQTRIFRTSSAFGLALTYIYLNTIITVASTQNDAELYSLTSSTSSEPVTIITTIDWSNIPTPPRFIHEPNDRIAYFSLPDYKAPSSANGGRNARDEHILGINGDNQLPHVFKPKTLRCAAVGVPKPEYKWIKDNISFPVNIYKDRIIPSTENGSLTFVKFTEMDEGEYQCLAINDNGTAYSEKMQLQLSWIRPFPDYKGPEIVSIPLGRPYVRDCVAPESNPPASPFWILQSPGNAKQISGINVSHISSNERGTIFFHYVQESDLKDNALYTCAAYNQEMKEYKFSNNQFNFDVKKRHTNERLRAIPPEQQWVNQSSPIALLGQIHKLHCFFSGFPNPTPIWFHNGQEIRPDNSKGFKFENFGKTLVFNVTAEHIGRYDCKFERHAAIDRTFDIKLNAAPYWFEHPPASVNTSEGETVVFDCKTLGNPQPVVTFYKNGVEMRKPRPGENWVIEGSKLTIYDVKKGNNGIQGDNAVYQCKAENKHGYLWTNFYLNLLAFQPRLLDEPGQVEAIEGHPFSLTCKFFASPQANVIWQSPMLSGAGYSTHVDQFGTGWLTFEKVGSNHDGEYKCIGMNKYGTISTVQRLVVRKPTSLEEFPEQRLERRAGIALELPCKAKHDPELEPEYVWTINGKRLEQIGLEAGHFRVTDDNTLVIEAPTQDDSGVYTCEVKTKLDTAKKTITVNIEDVPPPIHTARITNCNQEEPMVVIDFEHYEPADRTKPVDEFWIRYSVDQEVDQGKWHIYPVSVKALPYETVGDSLRLVRGTISILLKPFGIYTFQVIARNAIGDSAPFNIPGTCQTAQKPPGRNPSGVWVQGNQPDNLIVYWDPMPRDEWNAENFAYRLLYRRKEEGGEWKSVTVEDPFADKYTIDLGEVGAKTWDAYEVQVRAINGKGASTIMPEVIHGRTGEGDPGVTPTNFRLKEVTSTSAEFEWDPVDSFKVQGNFTGYKITYWHDENGLLDNDESNSNNNKEQQQAAIREARHQKHQLKVQASSSAQMYRLRRATLKTSGGQLERKSVIFGPDVTRGTVTGLKPNSMNYAVIAVLNGQNEGAPSQELSFRTREGVPTEVRDLRAYPMNNRHVTERAVVVLKWHPPRQMNGRLLKYTLEYCRAANTQRDDPENDDLTLCTTSPIDINKRRTEWREINLNYYTHYRFKLTAHTGAGKGLPNSVDARTLPEALHLNVEPRQPSLTKEGIGLDHFNISFVPGHFDDRVGGPVGNAFYVKYRESDTDNEWQTKEPPPPDGSTLQVTVDGLTPGTKYDVMTVALQRDEAGNIVGQTDSRVHHITTAGVSPKRATMYWLLIILLIALVVLLLICIICCLIYQRGRKYPVAEKERLHGREPMLAKNRQFEEFGGKAPDDEKHSLSGHVWGGGESESDSLVADVDDNRGYNEDGSFVNQYGASSKAGLAHSGSGPGDSRPSR